MVSNQKFELALEEINTITGLKGYVGTMDRVCLAKNLDDDAEFESLLEEFYQQDTYELDIKDYHFFLIEVEEEIDYVLALKGDGYHSTIGKMAAAQIRIVAISFAKQFDRNSFMQNVILSNLLPIDIITKAKKLHIEDEPRVVYLIDTAKRDNELVLETVKNLSNIKSKDFVFRFDESNVILIKALPAELKEEEQEELLRITAAQLVDNIQMEAMVKARVGYGNPAESIREVAKSYQEAKLALEVGRVFYAENDIISYGRLGIGRLIYQLPLSLCEMFIHEVFGDSVPEILEDEEAMNTVAKFFENSLNISETARQLYLHRNTLVYRLERIEKAVGLDIRNFEDAMTFRIAVMVLAHMKESKK